MYQTTLECFAKPDMMNFRGQLEAEEIHSAQETKIGETNLWSHHEYAAGAWQEGWS